MKRSELIEQEIKRLQQQEFEKTSARLKEMREKHIETGKMTDSEMWDIILKERDKTIDETIERLKVEKHRAIVKEELNVGDGVTLCLYSDREAYTVIKKTDKMLLLQRDKATLSPEFKPEFEVGGFCGHCTNQDEQKYTYEQDVNGRVIKAFWSEKLNNWYALGAGQGLVRPGRQEFYDYNF